MSTQFTPRNAPTDADYLVGTADPELSAEIVVGTAPGGELGGSWGSPTVDIVHSGSVHHAQIAAGDALTLTGGTLNFDGGAAPLGELGGTWGSPMVDATHSGSAHHAASDPGPPNGTASGELGGTYPSPTVDGTHSGSSHHNQISGGNALTLTGDTLDFDGGSSPAGELGGSWASPTVDATHSGSAHITGPGSSIDNAIVRWNGTGAVVLQGYTSGAPTISDTGAMTINAGGITVVAGDLDMSSSGEILNVGAAGNDWTANRIQVQNANSGGAVRVTVDNTSNTAASSALLDLTVGGTSGGDPAINYEIDGGQRVNVGLDNSASGNYTISDGGALGSNDRLRLVTTTGVLSLDGAGAGDAIPTLFDEYDDVLELRTFQLANVPTFLINREQQKQNQIRLAEIGVAEWAIQEDGSYHWMMRIQPMLRLLAGGIYQNRQYMNFYHADLEARIRKLENG